MKLQAGDHYVEWIKGGFRVGVFRARRRRLPWQSRLRAAPLLDLADLTEGEAHYYTSAAFLARVVLMVDARAGAVHAFYRGCGPSFPRRFRKDDEWGRLSVSVSELLADGHRPMPDLATVRRHHPSF